MIMTKFTSAGNLRRNRKGGIEGLPLQLMIIILVATMGTGIIIGWMGSIEVPGHIGTVECDSDIQLSYGNNGISLNVTVTDQNGDPLEGAAVVLSGCGISDRGGGTPYVLTDKNGIARFNDMSVNKVTSVRYVSITVSKDGYGENNTARIMVIP